MRATRCRRLAFIFLGYLATSSAIAQSPSVLQRIAPPPGGKLYHGIYPGGVSGDEDDVTVADLKAYVALAGHNVAWVYFSNNWNKTRAFPQEMATWIRDAGAVPFIRMMLRHTTDQNRPPREFKMQNVIDGNFDADLAAWAQAARDFASPLIVEFGTEVNGKWFPWNGLWNGAARKTGFGDPKVADGPERFVSAYRHVVQIFRDQAAVNVSWVFHVNAGDEPEARWNDLARYYPGDDYVDWLGLSAYGFQTPTEHTRAESFRALVDEVYPRLTALAPGKPIMALEFGHTAGNPRGEPAPWANAALTDLFAARWPAICGFSWWNERWENDENPRHNTTMRLQDIPALAAVFKTQLDAHAAALQESALVAPAP